MPPLIAYINTDRLRHNYQWLKAQHQGPLLAVVKSNAYGHGMIPCAKALADLADGFAVMHLEEALALREAGILSPILLLEGVMTEASLAVVATHQLVLALQSFLQLEAFIRTALPQPVSIWLKMDTGLSRGGFLPKEFAKAYEALVGHRNVKTITYMTHFACADDLEHPMTATQIATFFEGCRTLPKHPVSLAASSGILGHPASHQGWARAGLALYGISPLIQPIRHDLKPVMRFETRLFGLEDLPASQSVGYGATYRTKRPTRVGLIACGYGDGYPRLVASGTPVHFNGNFCPIIGRPSMNLITIDLTDIPIPVIGTPVTLWGDAVNVNTVATAAGTSAYETLCHAKPHQWVYESTPAPDPQ